MATPMIHVKFNRQIEKYIIGIKIRGYLGAQWDVAP